LLLTKWGVTWIVTTTVAFASLSVVFFSFLVTQEFVLVIYFFILSLAASIASFISDRQLTKIPKKETDLLNGHA
jgi:hypothetical protein